MQPPLATERISGLARRVLDGGDLSLREAETLILMPDEVTPLLLGWADVVKKYFRGAMVDVCAILNARSGRCPEDCLFCAQSARYRTPAKTYPLLSADEILKSAAAAYAAGAKRFSLVTGGRSAGSDFDTITGIIKRMKRELPGLGTCASLGALKPEEARALKTSGLDRYHHNLEAPASFFPSVCSTHSYPDRVATVRTAQEAGLEVCAGGIIGMGESPAQRVEMAVALRELGVFSVPINILHPVEGTPLASMPPLRPLEILRTLAVFRLVLPHACIRYAGGREYNLRDTQALGLAGGIDGLITGGYLTTPGQETARDLQLISDLGLRT
jgi:biotin synthase